MLVCLLCLRSGRETGGGATPGDPGAPLTTRLPWLSLFQLVRGARAQGTASRAHLPIGQQLVSAALLGRLARVGCARPGWWPCPSAGAAADPPPALPGRHAPLLGSTLLPQGDRGPHRRQRRWRAWRWGARTALASCRDVELSQSPGVWAAGPALGPSQHCGGQRGRPGAEPRTPISRFPSRGLRTDAGSPDPSSVPQMPTPPRPLFKHTRAKPRALQGRSGSHGPRVLVSAPPGSPVRVC